MVGSINWYFSDSKFKYRLLSLYLIWKILLKTNGRWRFFKNKNSCYLRWKLKSLEPEDFHNFKFDISLKNSNLEFFLKSNLNTPGALRERTAIFLNIHWLYCEMFNLIIPWLSCPVSKMKKKFAKIENKIEFRKKKTKWND